MRRAFRLAYDGRPFRGFQRQPDVPTVEDALFDALRAHGVFEGDKPPGYAAAGRTDAGVSALAQTVAFDCPEWLTPRALNAELHDAVRAWAHAAVPADFHATHDAVAREYVYHLYAPAADPALARDAARALSGAHDFHNLTSDDAGTERDLSLAVERDDDGDGDFLALRARAGGFPRGFVRRVASLVRSVATGAAPPSKVERVLAPDPLPGPEGVPEAPPGPLVLAGVDYDRPRFDVAFERDARAVRDTRAFFAEERAARRASARVAGTVVDGLTDR
ncbi:tRNA pseudouridine38-40 synthase [Halarchaeum rubridurum]|uniref:tRNA pseudouridine synthase A n=1 Tax=Halarchaeum rubridurum TaxID=489911 RepID=A0A830FKW5_9EURY|nr:tRNA pseudouridine(38-40) synthase TruA [Halarchaeum rubridurum]MBP1954084.1 tRNA pseudouridine38-40 synthase [Halarchaeum rubridurum]GGM57171.1 tRNA pseudouridine(38-40) synthase TruA [Halarchaeum rubridurum]